MSARILAAAKVNIQWTSQPLLSVGSGTTCFMISSMLEIPSWSHHLPAKKLQCIIDESTHSHIGTAMNLNLDYFLPSEKR